jgi:hypothetical protein
MKIFKEFRSQLKEATQCISVFDDNTARIAGNSIGVNWDEINFDEFVKGMNVETEHANITKGSPMMTARIALAHLQEIPDYYTRLAKMEKKK